MSLRSPIWWFGGKGTIAERLLPLLPPHRIYVEPFGGGASILFAKTPAAVEVYNDLNSGLVALFRVLRNPDQFDRFQRLCELTPYSREEYYHCRETWEAQGDEVERAHRFYVVARWSFSGSFGASWGHGVTFSRRGMAGTVSAWLSAVEALPEIHQRLRCVQIEHADFRRIFDQYDAPGTLFYCDPPYVHSTRRAGAYAHEMTDADHGEMIDRILALKGKAVVSGYASDLYRRLEGGAWRRFDIETSCTAVAKTRATGILGEGSATTMQPRTETVWLSPSCAAIDTGLFAADMPA